MPAKPRRAGCAREKGRAYGAASACGRARFPGAACWRLRAEQRAISRKAFKGLSFEEARPGELRDGETVQVWAYDPLVAGGDAVDDVSLVLTLVGEGDERVIGQLNALFEEELWQ